MRSLLPTMLLHEQLSLFSLLLHLALLIALLSSSGYSLTALVLLLLVSSLAGATLLLSRLTPPHRLRNPAWNPACSLSVAALSGIYFTLLIRLLGPPSNLLHVPGYSYVPQNLDFGPKDLDVSTGVYDGRNIAFENEGNTYGHFSWGLAVLLLFAAPLRRSRSSSSSSRRGAPPVPSLLDLFALACLSVYPLYNNLKRLLKHGETFATSSICNNGLEQISGVVVGAHVGLLAQVLVGRRPPDDGACKSSAPTKNGSCLRAFAWFFSFTLGLMLLLLLVGFSTSWEGDDKGALAAMWIVSVGTMAATSFIVRSRKDDDVEPSTIEAANDDTVKLGNPALQIKSRSEMLGFF